MIGFQFSWRDIPAKTEAEKFEITLPKALARFAKRIGGNARICQMNAEDLAELQPSANELTYEVGLIPIRGEFRLIGDK